MTTAIAATKTPAKKRRTKRSARGEGVRFQKIDKAVRRGQDVIDSTKSYTLAVFCRKTGLGPDAIRGYRTNGLKVRRVGNQLFVAGADWLAWLQTQPTE
jgi:hypothetical protein